MKADAKASPDAPEGEPTIAERGQKNSGDTTRPLSRRPRNASPPAQPVSTEPQATPIPGALREPAGDGISPTVLQERGGPPRSERAPASRSFPVSYWDRYEPVQFLGAGGMGRVFKARDPKLQRFVALKFLRENEPEHVRRLLREAQAQASIDHPNICKVYEVGEVEGQYYIAMQYIEGKALRAAKEEMSFEAKVEVMRKVADAMHAAHRLGVTHRDIKPANIMMGQEEGTWHPYVMDFGLAHISHGAGNTRVGVIEGTPSYMSPEQAQGHTRRLDRRTDVYSLGATLYDLLASRPPFGGEHTIEVIMRVIHEAPEPLRSLDRSIPEDLETIVLKCLEKEPERRYESAKALAEDLRRYLDGEPIHARTATLGYRVLKKARKHKALVALGGLALASVLAFAGFGVRAEIRAAERARLAQQLGRDVKDIESFLRLASFIPEHDVSPEKAAVRDRMRAMEVQMARVGNVGEGPGHYALGRGHLALHEYEEALVHLERSAATGYPEPELEYAMGCALGGLYRRHLDEAQRIADKDAREALRKDIEKKYLEPALAHIRKSSGSAAESPRYIDALIAFYGKRYDDAGRLAHEAAEHAPALYEAMMLEGDAHFILGGEKQDRGDNDGASSEHARAVEAYRRAAAVARSDESVHEALAEVWIQIMIMDVRRGADPKSAFESAIAACDSALSVNPESSNAMSKKSRAHGWLGQRRFTTGEDPRAAFEKAISFGQQAVRLDPRDAVTHDNMGNTFLYMGLYEDTRGLDPTRSFNLAIESFQRSIDVNPAFAWPWNDMGTTHLLKAEYEARRGIDYHPTLERGIELYKRAIEIDPSYAHPYSNMGLAYATLALRDAERGVDSRPLARLGVEACQKSIERNRSHAPAIVNMGNAQLAAALYELVSGGDPRPALGEAIESNTRALKLNATEPEIHQNLTNAYRMGALYALLQNGEAAEILARASAARGKMLEVDPSSARSQLLSGLLDLVAARLAMQKGEEPDGALRAAEASLRRAAELNPQSPEIHEATADLYRWTAELYLTRKKPIEEKVTLGLAAIEKALAINPRLQRAIALRGCLYLARARAYASTSGRVADAQLAESAFAEALRGNPAMEKEFGSSRRAAEELRKQP